MFCAMNFFCSDRRSSLSKYEACVRMKVHSFERAGNIGCFLPTHQAPLPLLRAPLLPDITPCGPYSRHFYQLPYNRKEVKGANPREESQLNPRLPHEWQVAGTATKSSREHQLT